MRQKAGFHQLTTKERERLFGLRRKGLSMRACARALQRPASTVSRELKRNSAYVGGTDVYLPDRADGLYRNRRKKCHPHIKLDDPRLRAMLIRYITRGWSPERIAGYLKKQQGRLLVCHEVLYQFIYDTQIGKREKLYQYLPRGKKRRSKKKGRKPHKDRLEGRIFIEARSTAANKRREIGHWETDSMLCKYRESINVLADRMSRKVIITKLNAKDAAATTTAITDRLRNETVRSITADNGPENAGHQTIAKILNTDFFFCHPYHSWEKGTVENRNGIIRRCLPRTTNLKTWSQEELDEIAEDMNTTPMKCLGYKTPNEVYSQCCI
jgi:IS30 family transposase